MYKVNRQAVSGRVYVSIRNQMFMDDIRGSDIIFYIQNPMIFDPPETDEMMGANSSPIPKFHPTGSSSSSSTDTSSGSDMVASPTSFGSDIFASPTSSGSDMDMASPASSVNYKHQSVDDAKERDEEDDYPWTLLFIPLLLNLMLLQYA